MREKVLESVASVLPITAIVLVISVTIAPLNAGTLVLFLFGAVMVVFGMGLFTMGADMAMTPMGEGIGVQMSHSKRIVVPLLVCFVLGILITLAEPDLTVLAEQMPAVPNRVLTITVAVGVGLFLAFAELRMLLKIPLSICLAVFYLLVFVLAYFAPNTFIPAAFDAGGVTTGPITVPFIMAMGVGLASLRSDKNSITDSFGLVAMCSIGPILSVLLLGIFYQPDSVSYTSVSVVEITTTRQAAAAFIQALPEYGREVAVALAPILAVFLLFQVIFRRFHRRQLARIAAGFVYTYVGLVLFLTGVNVGFMPVGQLLGVTLGARESRGLHVPLGMRIGYFSC
ncbi:MAG: DUF1538 domain-containing protein, partial [Oscillospiraceae bacterium]|nr:DUF1538 domain-containing protein [Oscillospiraceae bacterium]